MPRTVPPCASCGFFPPLRRTSNIVTLGPTEQQRRQRDQGSNQVQHATDGNSREPEWQENEPNDRIGNQCQYCNRPAQDEKDAPQQEFDHAVLPDLLGSFRYRALEPASEYLHDSAANASSEGRIV